MALELFRLIYVFNLPFVSLFQPPICDADGSNVLLKRRKRQTIELDETEGLLYDADRDDLKVKVYSGLYVNEATDLDDQLLDDDIADEIVSCHRTGTKKICFLKLKLEKPRKAHFVIYFLLLISFLVFSCL